MPPVLGRLGVVENLRSHLVKGTSAIVVGGPKMGKTTLLRQVRAALAKSHRTISVDLSENPSVALKGLNPDGPYAVIFLLDGCEALLPNPRPFLHEFLSQSKKPGKKITATVWAGGVAWGEWATANRNEFGRKIRFYPLILLPPKEVHPLVSHQLPMEGPSSELEQLLENAGGHPYLLSRLVNRSDGECGALFEAAWREADSPIQQSVLNQLMEANSWILLEDLKDHMGTRPPKKVLDRLATLGLIHRTIVEGAAAARIVSPLLIEWARRKKGEESSLPEASV